MIRTVIVDDEPNNIETLQQLLLKYCPQVELAGTADNATRAREAILHAKPDLVFLDIEMPYGNAFELLNSLPVIEFETTYGYMYLSVSQIRVSTRWGFGRNLTIKARIYTLPLMQIRDRPLESVVAVGAAF